MEGKRKAVQRTAATVFIVVGILLAAGTVWAAPAAEEEPEGPIPLTWMKHGSPGGVESRAQLIMDLFPELAERYTLEAVIAGPSADDVLRKFRLGFAAGETPPDLVMLQYSNLQEFALSGVLSDVSDIYEPVWDDVPPAAIEAVTVDGKQWGGVIQIKTKLWFYRADMFEAAGIDVDEIRTTEDFIEAGRTLRETFPESYLWNLGPNFASSAHYNFEMMISGNGGQLWSDDEQKYVVDTDPGVRAAFEDLREIYRAGITAPIDDWTPDWEQGFANDVIASTPISVWFVSNSYLPKWAPEQAGKWAVSTWPELGNAPNGGGSQGAGVTVVPREAPHVEGAKEVLSALLLTKEGALAHYQLVPTSFPTFYPAINDPAVSAPNPYYGNSFYEAMMESLEFFQLAPTTPATGLEYGIMNQHLQEYVFGDMPLDEILGRANQELTTQIGDPWELF